MSASVTSGQRRFWDFSRPLDMGQPTRDRYGRWDLNGGAHLLFMADAPNSARVETGRVIEMAISDFLTSKAGAISLFLTDADASDCQFLLADLGTWLNDELRRKDGGLYAACALCLITPDNVSALCVGDCVIYVAIGGRRYRLSDSTRLGGGFVAGLMSEFQRPVHYAEGVYLGAQPRAFRVEEVMCVRRDGNKAVVLLATDGGEAHFGCETLLKSVGFALNEGGISPGLVTGLNSLGGEHEAMDDVSLQMLCVPENPPKAPPESSGCDQLSGRCSKEAEEPSEPAREQDRDLGPVEGMVEQPAEAIWPTEGDTGQMPGDDGVADSRRAFFGRNVAVWLLLGCFLLLLLLLGVVVWEIIQQLAGNQSVLR